ncbi:TonB-dependent receptor, partial [bacterium]|nr:TonB-dependent receptor [bacterium]
MKNRLILNTSAIILIFLLYTVDTTASETVQKGKISGYVFNEQTGQPIPDANIIIAETRYGTASQDGGYFFIDQIPRGTYDIEARVIGYQSEVKYHVEIGNNTIIHFFLIQQPIEMDPILVTATMSDHLQSKVSVSSEVITLPRIKELNGNTAGEVIEPIGGLLVKDYGGFAGLKSLSIRGSNSEQVVILLNGLRLNSPQDGGIDLNSLPIEMIERIEIIRGGHSALLGTDAIGGVINLITKDSQSPKGFSYGTQFTIGSFGTRNQTFSGSHQFGSLQFFLHYSHLKSDGNFGYIHPITQNYAIIKNNQFEGKNVFAKVNFKLGLKNNFQFIQQFIKNDRGIPGTANYPSLTTHRDEERKLYTLHAENQLTDRLRFEEQLLYQAYKNHYTNSNRYYPADDLHEHTAYGFHIQGQWHINTHLNMIIGSEIRSDNLNSYKKLQKNEFIIKDRTTKSVFIQTEIGHTMTLLGMKTQWKWIPALRWDDFSDIEASISPKLGAIISSGNYTNIAIRGNVGKSFRVPTFNDLYWPEEINIWGGMKGNPNLAPEKSINYDIGLLFRIYQSFNIEAELTYFYNNIKDLILWDTGSDWIYSP